MIKKYKKYILIAILLLAAVLRFYQLADYPALNADEAAIGYNAYSLIETGKDEHGNPWPIHFQSFNDYKPGLYFYMVLPFVKFLGLNEWAVRIPGAFLGLATVFALYFLVKEIFNDEKLALVSSLFLAISPWHIHFSRGGWEVNVATFFITLGLYLFVRGTNKRSRKLLIFSVLSFAASFYTYHAARVIVPLLGIGLLILKKDAVRRDLKKYLVVAFVGFLVLLPLAKDLTTSDVLSRAAGVGLFADPGPISRINEQRGQHEDFRSRPAVVLHNKAVNYGLEFLENWTEHYSGEFLFLSGDDIERNKVPETGVIYLFDILLLGVAFFAIVKKPKGWGIPLWWLLVAPSAAALTFQSPHALRAQNMSVPLAIVGAFGLFKLIELISKNVKAKSLAKVFYVLIGFLVVWNFARYQHMYWVHMAKEYAFSSQYGVKELVGFAENNEERYEKVVVTDRYDQPYILFLFYLKYSPEKFQEKHSLTPRDEFGFSTVREFGKYHFIMMDDWDSVRSDYRNSLIAGTDEEIPNEANIIKRIYGTNDYLYFEVVAN